MTRASIGLVLLAAVAPAAASLRDRLDTPTLRPLGDALALSVGKSLPVPAASAGITFTFDPRTSAFVRDTELAGQVFLERARPIGAGRWNASLTYQRFALDTFDGHELDSLRDTNPIQQGARSFVLPRLRLELVTHEITTSVTYGVTDDLEVNATLPLLDTHLDLDARLHQLGGAPFPNQGGATHDATFGVGDLLLRTKYRLLHGGLGDVAAGLVFRLPTGNEDDFQGTGLFELSPMLYASTAMVTLAPGVRVQGHLNVGLDLPPQDASRGEGRWGAGLDCMLASRMTLSIAFLARESFSPLTSEHFFDVPRSNGTATPLFGFAPGRASYYDLSFGSRVNLWRDTVFGIVNVVVPVNEDGARPSVVPLVGLEATF